ncbi:MAG: DUF3365 domain-containing protein [Bacteroidales bacterium]|nr:DUF3365 domain-containing protein [Bacteroidales bacterium]
MNNFKISLIFILGMMFLLLNCNNATNENIKSSEATKDSIYKELGLKYAKATKEVLGKNLQVAINTNGTENALEFCSEKAYPLTDSMAVALNISIKRVSDKPRNQKNAANKAELEYISLFKKNIENNEKITPQLKENGAKIIAYYPIISNEMCLLCHGKPNEHIKSEVQSKINNLYPHDKATGYDKNQVRGIWVVEMDKIE